MKSPDVQQADTTNMAEALYLVQQGNRIIGLEMCVCHEELPREECRFRIEGATAWDDHRYYISHNMSDMDLSRLPLLFHAAQKALAEARS